jgi:hypothetical protein
MTSSSGDPFGWVEPIYGEARTNWAPVPWADLAPLSAFAGGCEKSDPPGEMPLPLTQMELRSFEAAGLTRVSWEDFMDAETAPIRPFRARYRLLR